MIIKQDLLVPYFLEKYNLDLLTYAGNLKECENNPRYKFIKGDICNREFSEYDIKGVIHFAAESLLKIREYLYKQM